MSEENKNPLIEAVLKLQEKMVGYGGKGDPYQGRSQQRFTAASTTPDALRVNTSAPVSASAPAGMMGKLAAPPIPKLRPTSAPVVVPTSAPPPTTPTTSSAPSQADLDFVKKVNAASTQNVPASAPPTPPLDTTRDAALDNPTTESPMAKALNGVGSSPGKTIAPVNPEDAKKSTNFFRLNKTIDSRTPNFFKMVGRDISQKFLGQQSVEKPYYNSSSSSVSSLGSRISGSIADAQSDSKKTGSQPRVLYRAGKKYTSTNEETTNYSEESTTMSNPLIDAFLKLQSSKSSNLFAEAKKAKKLDPVGKEDEDVDNDGDSDKSDKYLKNRREAISKAVKEAKDPYAELDAPKSGGKAPDVTPKPEYATQSKEQTPNRAAKTSLPKGVSVQKEEVEQLDELSPKTLRSYRDAANWDVRGIRGDEESNDEFDREAMMKRRRKGAVMSAKKLRGTAKVNAKEEVEFSEAELAHIASIIEAVAPTPEDHASNATPENNATGGKGRGSMTEEDVVKRGRGRPKGSKSGSKHGGGGNAAGVTHLVDQIKHAGTRGIADGKGNYMLKHEHGTNKDGSPKVHTAAVPQKAANDFYKSYHGIEKPAAKQELHDKFVAKHFGISKGASKPGISLASMPRPKS